MRERKMKITNYWTFFNNPKYWNLEKYLCDLKNDQSLKKLTWTIAPCLYEDFKINQFGVLRIGQDQRTKLKSGVYAIVKVVSTPFDKQTLITSDDEYCSDKTSTYLKKKIVLI